MKPHSKIEPFHLIQTKLYRPQTGANLVSRPHLLNRLTEGLQHHLILISAPPGFGKTTLAGQWLANCSRPSTWLSLDESDNDLPQFLRYVCAAVRRVFPETCATLQDLLSTVNLPSPDYLADLLVEELNALPTELILVLDDYHRIRAGDVHHLLRRLLRYRPPRLHLVILTRSDPPLFLGRLRMSRQITEIRAADLRFALTETRRLLQEQGDPPLDEAIVQSLQTRTEGWVIGLQLAGISLHNQSPAQLMARFGGSHRLLAGYLVEEVMADLPEDVIEFLIRTALVPRFCAALGDALLADSPWPASSQATIARLEAQNMFIIPLDNEGIWYRYHDLFRDFLLHRLKAEKDRSGLNQLHRRAADWLAQANLVEDAIRHALAAGDETRAADLVETNLHPLLNQQIPAPVLGRRLDLMPEQAIQTHPGLLIAQLFLFTFRWDMAAITALLEQADTLMQTDNTADNQRRQVRLAVLDALRGYLLYWRGDACRAIQLFQRSLNNLNNPVDYAYVYAQTTHFLAMAYANCGRRETALDLLRGAIAEATAHHRPSLMNFLGSRTIVQLYAGELTEVAAVTERMLEVSESMQTHPAWSGAGPVQVWRGWAHYFLGLARYEQNDLEAAAQQWRQVETMRYRVNPGAFHNSLAGLALVAQAQGQTVEALAYAQTTREFAIELRSPPLLTLSEALEARLALLNNNHVEAMRRSQEIDTAVNQGNSIWLEPPFVTVLRVLLADATPDSLTTARQLAATGLDRAENAHNTRQVIQILALQALIRQALHRAAKSFEALDRALILAEPFDFARSFLDLGAPMAELLQQFDRKRGPCTYVRRLLAAFAGELDPIGRRDLTAQYVQLYNITPLTRRELELLELVGRRLTVNEMAAQLVISPNTVKKHVTNIYSKLGVKNRRQAIEKAQEAGLLPPAESLRG